MIFAGRFQSLFRIQCRLLTNLPRLGILQNSLNFLDKEAICSSVGSLSYREILFNAHRMAEDLKQKYNIQQGDRIALIMPKGHAFVIGLLATWFCDAVAVPLYPTSPQNELLYSIRNSGSTCCLSHPLFIEKVNEIKAHVSIHCESFDESNLFNATHESFKASRDIDKNANALIIYTSGTTGNPKGVVMTHQILENQIKTLVDCWRWTSCDRIHHVLPLHHVHGLVNCLLCSLWSAATCEFAHSVNSRDIFKRWMQKENSLSLFMAVPTLYAKLYNEYQHLNQQEQIQMKNSCQSFRLMVSGSSALPDALARKWKQITGHALLERYGSTEVGMALGHPIDGDKIPGTVGVPFPNVKVKLVNEQLQDVTLKQIPGELYIQSPHVFKEYWENPTATQDAFTLENGDKWFKSGDIAIRLENGYFKILGRASVDIIKSGGYKISALEIEKELMEMPQLQDVAILGIPDPQYGQIVALVCTTKDLTLEHVQLWLSNRLSKYKIPRKLFVIKEMPRNALGKINKKQLLNFLFKMKKEI